MTKRIARDAICRQGAFDADSIQLCEGMSPSGCRVETEESAAHAFFQKSLASTAGYKSWASAGISIAAIERAHRIRKGQFLLAAAVGDVPGRVKPNGR